MSDYALFNTRWLKEGKKGQEKNSTNYSTSTPSFTGNMYHVTGNIKGSLPAT